MTPRAPALPVEERRRTLVAATVPLLREKGRSVTTKDVARAAGVAEGTIFRAFESKDELIEEAIQAAFAPDSYIAQLEAIDRALPFEARLVELIRITQNRFQESFTLMRAVGLMGPPTATVTPDQTDQLHRAVSSVINGADLPSLRVPPAQLATLCRILAFASANPRFTDNHDFTPELLASVLLDGLRDQTQHDPGEGPCS